MNVLTANKRKSVTRYDFETLDWQARVITAGGTVSQATKDAVQTFVANMKSYGLWALCQEIGIFAGSNLAAALVKLKYVTAANLTNNNFVAGDYAETGSNGGLLGNGTTKYLDTGYNVQTSMAATSHISFYQREALTGAQCAMIGVGDGGNTNQFMIYSNTPGTDLSARLGLALASTAVSNAGSQAGFLLVTRGSSTDLRFYRSGAQLATNANPTTFTPLNLSFYLWALNANGVAALRMGFRGSFYSIGAAMTANQAGTFYQLVQALQTALSRQV